MCTIPIRTSFIPLLLIVVASGCTRVRMLIDNSGALPENSEMKSLLLYPHNIGVHCMTAGNDTLPTLFIVHGSPGGWKDYKRYLEDDTLVSQFRVVVFDRPGFGKSDQGEAVSLQNQVELLYQFAVLLDNGKPRYWMGHSLGGPIVTLMASLHPSIADGLAIVAGSVSPEEEAPEKWRRLLKWPALRWMIPAKFDRSNIEIMNFKKDIRLLDNCWEKITCPVLILHGTKDPLVPYANATYAMKRLNHNPRVRLTPIENANHFIPWEHYLLIRNSIQKFFI